MNSIRSWDGRSGVLVRGMRVGLMEVDVMLLSSGRKFEIGTKRIDRDMEGWLGDVGVEMMAGTRVVTKRRCFEMACSL